MAGTITLFEHEKQEFNWTENDLAVIERLKRSTGREVLRASIKGGQRAVEATQMVGVVRLATKTVQILPKIYGTDADDATTRQREATRNLLTLLNFALAVDVHEHAVLPLLERDSDWFEILTHLFATHLVAEWQRGPHRTYFRIEDDTTVLKGKWKIPMQLRRPDRRHRFSVTFDDFGIDNQLNRVFRFAVERLWSLTRVADNRRLLGTLRQWMDEVTLQPRVTVADASPALISRLNQRFGPLLSLARLFLDGGSLQLLSGNTTAFALLFDMNQLFEGFVTRFIQMHRSEILPDALQSCELLPRARTVARHLARASNRAVFRLEPDLAFRQGGDFPLLLDAKYKRIDAEPHSLGVSHDDFYQMYAYAHRYQCPRVILVYPKTVDHPSPLSAAFHLLDSTQTIEARTVDLCADLAQAAARQHLINEFKKILAGVT